MYACGMPLTVYFATPCARARHSVVVGGGVFRGTFCDVFLVTYMCCTLALAPSLHACSLLLLLAFHLCILACPRLWQATLIQTSIRAIARLRHAYCNTCKQLYSSLLLSHDFPSCLCLLNFLLLSLKSIPKTCVPCLICLFWVFW